MAKAYQNNTFASGILKNSNSYQQASPNTSVSPTSERTPSVSHGGRPQLSHQMSEKEVVQMNTNINAGNATSRRNSSNPRGSMSRRQSGSDGFAHDENNPRLKWDEANLFLNEQQQDSTMKIDEPKTPYAKRYDPSEDEEELNALNVSDLVVDELDAAKAQKKQPREDEIPGLDIGEPEMDQGELLPADTEKRVSVDTAMTDADDDGRHGEELANMTAEEREKHRKFEAMRKKHYEMKNVKGLLGHSEDLDALSEEDGDR
ncbi:hypothetical protein LTR04_004952 [Oleoguttula sp. CCFEE 6159]|nr:hypothetical protein LTR04_004952 [Oleoguttula sp. CCFEE 6159]